VFFGLIGSYVETHSLFALTLYDLIWRQQEEICEIRAEQFGVSSVESQMSFVFYHMCITKTDYERCATLEETTPCAFK
jgi:hypothetical protein